MAAIVELLEQKGFCTKQELPDIIDERRKKNPRARIPETGFPEPYVLTETEHKTIDDILALLNKTGADLAPVAKPARTVGADHREARGWRRGRCTEYTRSQAHGPE